MSSTISKLGLKVYEWKPWLGRLVGPNGETLAAVPCGVALAILLFAPQDWLVFREAPGRIILPLLILLLARLAAYFLLVAVGYAESLLKEQVDVPEKRYQATPTRVLVLKAAGVPEDIIEALRGLLTALPCDDKARALLTTPQPEKEFIDWLARGVGLGHARVEESRTLILRYTEVDAEETVATQNSSGQDNMDEGEGAERKPAGSTPPTQVVPNGASAVVN
jgi:hypothetical protein